MNRIKYPAVLLAFFFFASSPVAAEPDTEKLYVIHFSTGPNWVQEKAPMDQEGFAGHSANLQRLRKNGEILFGARYGELGMIVMAGSSAEVIQQELDADPGVVAGIFTYDIDALNVFYPWRDE